MSVRAIWFVLLGALVVGIVVFYQMRQSSLNQALITAVRQGASAEVEALLNKGANPNATDEEGQAVICNATRAPVTARIHATQSNGMSVQIEKHRGFSETVRVLVGRGADVNVRDRHGVSLLQQAQREDDFDTVQFLTKAGARK